MKILRLFIYLFLLSFGATLLFTQPGSPFGHAPGGIRIEVNSGQDLQSIAEVLKANGIIRSTALFRTYLKSRGVDRDIKPGTFLALPDASYADLADLLTGTEGNEIKVTIPEGYTAAQIDERLASMGLIEAGEFVQCAQTCDFSTFEFLPKAYPGGHGGRVEGYLFPDTYFVNASDFVPQFFIERLLGTFRQRIIAGLASEIASSGRSLHQIVTMASIVERETRTDDERPIVSGILWKRFDANRGLDADATIRYGLQKLTEPLTHDDLQNRHAYNTRRHAGLPPGPIASPGLASIKATLSSQETEYWYYLHGKDGQAHYSKTNEEHNEKKVKYL